MADTKNKILRVRVEENLSKRVAKLAKKKGVASAKIVRRAITEYLVTQEELA